MTEQAATWKTVRRILEDLVDLSEEERKRFLDSAGIDEKIRAEVEEFLADEPSPDFLAAGAAECFADLVDVAGPNMIGQRVGSYVLVGEIGCGGMGAVYLARRADGRFEQQVAVKMLRRELNFANIRRNFEREKEILSRIAHPNIARLLDAGTTNDGIPYLVMEYVDGVPIDEYSRHLSLHERLKLFSRVCGAVAFLHRNLIVHRDLKPSNILVGDDGEPRLLDFGISKLLDDGTHGRSSTTDIRAMTPEYASPEQITGQSVTTSSDIYSLGVILYQILTGEHPYGATSTGAELSRLVVEGQPRPPSSAKTDFRREFRGDIDNIVLKSMSPEPERRYATVEAFAADVWRYVDRLPVEARPSTFGYRFSRLYARNKLAFVSGAIVAVSIFIGAAVSVRQAGAARAGAAAAEEQRMIAQSESERARSEQAKSEKVTQFMSRIIAYANPRWYAEGARFGQDARVIDAIVDLSDRIDADFLYEPDIAAELHHRFAEVIGSNGGALRAVERERKILFHARRALELRRAYYGDRHELVAKDMAYLYWAGGVDRAQMAEYLMSAIEMMRETNPNNLNLPFMLEDYASHLLLPEFETEVHDRYRRAYRGDATDRYEIAESLTREGLALLRKHYSQDNFAIMLAECRLAYSLAMQDKWSDFSPHYAVCTEYRDATPETDRKRKYFTDLVEARIRK